MTGRLVVGIDGSASAEAALRWAVRTADGRPVVAALAYGPLGRPDDLFGRPTGRPDDLAAAAREMVAKAVAQVAPSEDLDASVPIETAVVYDEPAAGLLGLLDGDDVLVLGSRGWGRMRRLLLGSVALQCLQQHPGTVVVVRGAVDDRPVTVGVDGTADSLLALRWAAGFAERLGVELEVTYAWSAPPSLHPSPRALLDRQRQYDHAEADLRRLVRATLGAGAAEAVTVRTQVVCDSPVSALTRHAPDDVQLLVLGRGGPGALLHRPIGSTALSAAANAHCSVAVVGAMPPPAG